MTPLDLGILYGWIAFFAAIGILVVTGTKRRVNVTIHPDVLAEETKREAQSIRLLHSRAKEHEESFTRSGHRRNSESETTRRRQG